jgi:hypothetical protein
VQSAAGSVQGGAGSVQGHRAICAGGAAHSVQGAPRIQCRVAPRDLCRRRRAFSAGGAAHSVQGAPRIQCRGRRAFSAGGAAHSVQGSPRMHQGAQKIIAHQRQVLRLDAANEVSVRGGVRWCESADGVYCDLMRASAFLYRTSVVCCARIQWACMILYCSQARWLAAWKPARNAKLSSWLLSRVTARMQASS